MRVTGRAASAVQAALRVIAIDSIMCTTAGSSAVIRTAGIRRRSIIECGGRPRAPCELRNRLRLALFRPNALRARVPIRKYPGVLLNYMRRWGNVIRNSAGPRNAGTSAPATSDVICTGVEWLGRDGCSRGYSRERRQIFPVTSPRLNTRALRATDVSRGPRPTLARDLRDVWK